MDYISFLRSPKKEEQHVPDSIDTQFVDIREQPCAYKLDDGDLDIMDKLEGIIWSVDNEDEEQKLATDHSSVSHTQLTWEGFVNGDELRGRDQLQFECSRSFLAYQESEKKVKVKKENLGFWDEDENRVSLNLNLNYQEVLDAWSDRGPLWADDFSLSMANHGCYIGEVPVMEEDRTRRREASVQRYKEKRQSRLFSKKIRYQVRKLNADKRPRLKGRFVKRV